MAIADLTLASILAPTTIAPGLAGWDGILDQRLMDGLTERRSGLLARIQNLVVTSAASSGTILMTVPPGYQAFVENVMLFWSGTNPASGHTLTFGTGAPASNPVDWHSGFLTTGLVTGKYLRLETNIAATTPLTVLDGDVTNAKDFKARSSTAGNNPMIDYWIFGTVWPK